MSKVSQRLAEKILRHWQGKLRLLDLDITITSADPQTCDETELMSINADNDGHSRSYWRIEVSPRGWMLSPEKFYSTVGHELGHLITWDYRDIIRKQGAAFRAIDERIADRLELIFATLSPMPKEWRD